MVIPGKLYLDRFVIPNFKGFKYFPGVENPLRIQGRLDRPHCLDFRFAVLQFHKRNFCQTDPVLPGYRATQIHDLLHELSNPEIFKKEGEARFREYERSFIESGHAATGYVVACGGGLVVQPGMVDLLRARGVVVSLFASVETIIERTARNNKRPLLNVEDPEQSSTSSASILYTAATILRIDISPLYRKWNIRTSQ